MQHNSDFESGYYNHHDDLGECSQIFKPTSALVDFFGKIGKRIGKRTTIKKFSKSYDQTKYQSVATEFGTTLHDEKTKINSEDEYGMSDSESSIDIAGDEDSNRSNYEGRAEEERITTITRIASGEVGENEHREKSPGFGDFFRINDDHIRYTSNGRCTCILPADCNCVNASNDNEKTIRRSTTPEEMDSIYTRDSDDDGSHGDNQQSGDRKCYETVDMHSTEDTDILQRAASKCFNYNWHGNVCYVSDVIVPPGRDGILRFIDDICRYIEFYRVQPFIIVSEHDDHVHIAHACHQANQACRCAWLQRCSGFRKYRRKHIRGCIYACNLGSSDWTAIMRYFCSNGRVAKKVRLPGADERLYYQIRNFSSSKNTICSKEGLVETCLDSGSWDLFRRKSALRRGDAGGRGNIGRRIQTAEQKNGVDGQHKFPVTIEDLLKYYPTCPPDAFTNIDEFIYNPYLNKLEENDRCVRVALRNWCLILRGWNVFDFNTYYHTTGVKPYFNGYARTSTNIYYSVEKSLSIANKLLLFQFNNNKNDVFNFLQTLYNIVDKKIPKLNSLCIHSAPSAGKNYFFDAVASYFLNYGMFGTANKNNNFTWADGAGKRIVIWNEPNYEQYHIETMKELLGGATTRVHVKYKGDQSLQRPPIILLTNNYLSICNEPLFADRLRTYKWQAAPFLKNCDKKLNPLFFLKLLLQWNVV